MNERELDAIREYQREFKAEADEASERYRHGRYVVAPGWKLYHAIDELIVEVERLQEYKTGREVEDAALNIDIDRIIAGLPPLTPGKASIALGKLRTALGMENGAIGKVIEAATEEIERLQGQVADMSLVIEVHNAEIERLIKELLTARGER